MSGRLRQRMSLLSFSRTRKSVKKSKSVRPAPERVCQCDTLPHGDLRQQPQTGRRAHASEFAADNPEYNVKKVLASVKADEGDAPKCILAAAKNMPVDMIVMGSRGRSPMGEIFIGSVAAKVTMKAKIPVVLVPIDS